MVRFSHQRRARQDGKYYQSTAVNMRQSHVLRIKKSEYNGLPAFSLTRALGRGQTREPLLRTRSGKPLIIVSATKVNHPSFFMGLVHANPGFHSCSMSTGMTIEHIVVGIIRQCRRRRLVTQYSGFVTESGGSAIAVGTKRQSELRGRA
jgi:hypothetical protein